MRYLKPSGIALALLCLAPFALARGGAPEKPGPQELLLKDGRKVTVLWQQFKIHRFNLYMRRGAAFINEERLSDQSPEVRRIVQWSAEAQGIQGDVEQHLRDSLKRPMKFRIVAANPLVLEVPYATGINIRTGRTMALPVCAVDPDDQPLMWSAARQMQVYDDYVDRELSQVAAAKAAAFAAEETASAAKKIADNTQEILSMLSE